MLNLVSHKITSDNHTRADSREKISNQHYPQKPVGICAKQGGYLGTRCKGYRAVHVVILQPVRTGFAELRVVADAVKMERSKTLMQSLIRQS